MQTTTKLRDEVTRAKQQEAGSPGGARFAEASAVAAAAGALMLGTAQANAVRDGEEDFANARPQQRGHQPAHCQTIEDHVPHQAADIRTPLSEGGDPSSSDPEVDGLVARIAEHIASGVQYMAEGAMSGAPVAGLTQSLATDIVAQARAIAEELRLGEGSVVRPEASDTGLAGVEPSDGLLGHLEGLHATIGGSITNSFDTLGTLSEALLYGGGQLASDINATLDDLTSDDILTSLLHGSPGDVGQIAPISDLVANLQGVGTSIDPIDSSADATDILAIPESVLGGAASGNPLASIFYDDGASNTISSVGDDGGPVKLGFLGQALDLSDSLGGMSHTANALHLA